MDRLIKNIMARIAKKREDYYLNDDVYDKVSVDALDFACDVIEEEVKEYNNGWIPCEVELPEEKPFPTEDSEVTYSDWVLVTTKHDRETTVGMGCLSRGHWYWIEGLIQTDVIAWMPLPSPYKKENKYE